MEATTIAIDLAKNVFELAVADQTGSVVDRKRLSRSQFRRYFENRAPAHIVMEACGSAHYWGRWFSELGMRVSLLPPHYVRGYPRLASKVESFVAEMPAIRTDREVFLKRMLAQSRPREPRIR